MHAPRYLGDYYSFTGDFAEQIAAGALTSPREIADAVASFIARAAMSYALVNGM